MDTEKLCILFFPTRVAQIISNGYSKVLNPLFLEKYWLEEKCPIYCCRISHYSSNADHDFQCRLKVQFTVSYGTLYFWPHRWKLEIFAPGYRLDLDIKVIFRPLKIVSLGQTQSAT